MHKKLISFYWLNLYLHSTGTHTQCIMCLNLMGLLYWRVISWPCKIMTEILAPVEHTNWTLSAYHCWVDWSNVSSKVLHSRIQQQLSIKLGASQSTTQCSTTMALLPHTRAQTNLAGFEHSFEQMYTRMWVEWFKLLLVIIASEENISCGTWNVNVLIFVHYELHDLKNLFALSQANVCNFDQVCKV